MVSTESFDLYLETLFELYESTSYSDTRKALEMALNDISNKLLAEDNINTVTQLNKYKSLIQDEINKSYSGLQDGLQNEVSDVSQLVASNYGLLSVNTNVINDLVGRNSNIQGYTFGDLFKTTKDNHIRALKTLISSQVAQGIAPNKIAKMLLDKNSSMTKSQLQTAVFTTISEARERAREEGYDNFKFPKKYVYIATLDGRTSNYCREHDGKIYTDKTKAFREIKVHFNCRSVIGVVANEADIPTERASVFGSTQNVPYSEWIKTLNDDQLKVILGSKYNAYKQGTYTIKGLSDVKNTGTKLSLSDIKKAVKIAPKVPTIDFGYGGKFNKYVEDIRDEAKIVIDKLPKPLKMEDSGSSYSSVGGILKGGGENPYRTFRHEYGHHVDFVLGAKKITGGKYNGISFNGLSEDKFNALLDLDKKYLKITPKNYDEILKPIIDDLGEIKKIKKRVLEFEQFVMKDDYLSGISDILDAMTGGVVSNRYGGSGHGISYYKNKSNRYNETFANLFELYSSKTYWEKSKQLFPNLTEEFENVMKEVIDGKFD